MKKTIFVLLAILILAAIPAFTGVKTLRYGTLNKTLSYKTTGGINGFTIATVPAEDTYTVTTTFRKRGDKEQSVFKTTFKQDIPATPVDNYESMYGFSVPLSDIFDKSQKSDIHLVNEIDLSPDKEFVDMTTLLVRIREGGLDAAKDLGVTDLGTFRTIKDIKTNTVEWKSLPCTNYEIQFHPSGFVSMTLTNDAMRLPVRFEFRLPNLTTTATLRL